MLKGKCYGILQDDSMIYGDNCFEDVKDCIKSALNFGATSFMLGDSGDFNSKVLKILTKLNKNRKNPFDIIIISTDNTHPKLLEQFKNYNLLILHNNNLNSNIAKNFIINQFIINNSYKNIAFENIKLFESLSVKEFIVINPLNNKEICIAPKPVDPNEYINMSGITLLE